MSGRRSDRRQVRDDARVGIAREPEERDPCQNCLPEIHFEPPAANQALMPVLKRMSFTPVPSIACTGRANKTPSRYNVFGLRFLRKCKIFRQDQYTRLTVKEPGLRAPR